MAKKKSVKPKKHVPQRTCIICREKADKRTLTRIVRSTDEGVVVDNSGKKNGRGAYVCQKSSCWQSLISGHRLNQALKTEVTEEEKTTIWEKRPQIASEA